MTEPCAHPGRTKAFTLLEISIVLVLISLVAGGALVMFTASVQQAQYNSTVATMGAIDTALYNYRLTNNRLPCPGNLTITAGNGGYGMEAGTLTPGISAATIPSTGIGTGACTSDNPVQVFSGGMWGTQTLSPYANFLSGINGPGPDAYSAAAEGSVPTQALKLPDSYMYDGWGNHIRYAVDLGATVINAFTTLPNASLNACGSVIINDATGAARSSAAIYALLSHGANGYCAYTQNGVLSAVSSNNTNEQTNCTDNNAGGGDDVVTMAYVQQLPAYESPTYAGNSLYYFDDIVTFKERWQLQSPQDGNPPLAPGNGLGLVVGGSNGTIYPYQQSGATFTYVSPTYLDLSLNPTGPPALTAINGMAISPDNTMLGIAGVPIGGNPSMIEYSVAGSVLTAHPWGGSGGTTTNGIAFSKDERLLASTGGGAVALYQPLQGSVPGTWPAADGAMTFSPDGQYFVVVSATTPPTLLVYGVNCTTLNSLTTLTTSNVLPAGITAISAVSFSNDDKYLALAATVSGAAEILIYKNVGGTASLVATLVPPGGNTSATGVAFSHSGNTLAAVAQGGSNTQFIYFYTNNRNDTFTAFSPVTISAGANAAAVAWSNDDQFVAVADGAVDSGGTGYAWDGLALYQVIGTTVNPLPAVATPPHVATNVVTFTN